MVDDIRELTEQDFACAIPRRQRERIVRGRIDAAKDIAALRRFAGLMQEEFAEALSISVHTLRNWEQGRRRPEGPALALLRVAARHPRVLRENLAAPARTDTPSGQRSHSRLAGMRAAWRGCLFRSSPSRG